MSKITISALMVGLLAATNSLAAVVFTNTVRVTTADNNTAYCQVVNISNEPQSVKAEMIHFDGTLAGENTVTVPVGVTSYLLSLSGANVLPRCKFTLNKSKVRAGIAVYKNLGDGSIELFLEAR